MQLGVIGLEGTVKKLLSAMRHAFGGHVEPR